MKRRDFLKMSVVAGLGCGFSPLTPSAFGSEMKYRAYYKLSDDLANIEYLVETSAIDFGKEKHSPLLLTGWSHYEMGHRWAVGKEADLEFYTFHPDKDKKVVLRCKAFQKLPTQSITVFLNGHPLGRLSLGKKPASYKLLFPSKFLKKYRNHVRFLFERSGTPVHFKMSRDNRELAVDFYKIIFKTEGFPKNSLNAIEEGLRKGADCVVLPLNSMLSQTVLIKPSTSMDLQIAGMPERENTSFEIILEYKNDIDTVFSQSDLKKPIQRDIDLSKYANEIVKLRFIYEGEGTTPNDHSQIRMNAVLKRPATETQDTLPNVLFIIVDTLRADHLGCYGSQCHTPNIDKLAEGGALFKWAFSHAPSTLPSHASIFTSNYPNQNMVLNNGQRVPQSAVTIAELLSASGQKTAGIISLGTLDSSTNIDQGFRFYSDTADIFGRIRTARDVNDEMEEFTSILSQSKNWFCLLHYSDPHEPYHAHGLRSSPVDITLNGARIGNIDIANQSTATFDAILKPKGNILKFVTAKNFYIRLLNLKPTGLKWKPLSGITKKEGDWYASNNAEIEVFNHNVEPKQCKISLFMIEDLNEKEIRESYQKEVEYVDRKIGEMLSYFKGKGLLKNTLVIFSSDHGEGIGDHGLIGHSQQLYNTLIHVPLIISYPGKIPRQRVISDCVRHIDILPTILDVFGVSADAPLRGASLLPMIQGKDMGNRPVLSMTFRPGARHNLVSLIDGHYKIIKDLDSNAVELYDIKKDPQEMTDLGGENVLKLNRMERGLQRMMVKEGYNLASDLSKAKSLELNKDQIEVLRGLGYAK